MDSINLSSLVNEILAGSSRAVIAMLILIIMGLLNEIRLGRKEHRDVLENLETQRTQFLDVMTDMQTRFSDKSDEMLEKYHKTIVTQNESNGKVREILANIAHLHSNKSDN